MAPFCILFLLLLLRQCLNSSQISDTEALLHLKSSFLNPDPALSSWSASFPAASRDDLPASPCSASWTGVLCFRGIVTSLRLGGLGLQGTIDVQALTHFRALRSVSFINNNFSGPLPDIGRLDALKSVYLSNNRFSGPINDSMFSSMDHLKKLWLDGNTLSGRIPSSLSQISVLMELHLEGNAFSGAVPALELPSLRSFNVSNNDLHGPIPATLAHFGASAFVGNPKLCGPPLSGSSCTIKTAEFPQFDSSEKPSSGESSKLILLFSILFIFLVAVIGFAAFRNNNKVHFTDSFISQHDSLAVAEAMEAAASASPVQLPASRRHSKKRNGSYKGTGSGSNRGNNGGGGGSELVMVNDEKGVFGLPDLMRAAAEVLGNGGLGSVYKALMANGVAVAVKRMRELNRLSKEGFEAEMRNLGQLRHPNVLTPLAYHFRKEEKLVVSEFIAKGSLLYILHGDRGADHAALNWPTRLQIIRGIASAMSYLHAALPSYDLPHGNLKTGNILLTSDFKPILADYALIALTNPSSAPKYLFAFKSPESPRVTPKSDVYCFGIVLLEILTGKFPSQYLNNGNGGTDVVYWAASAVAENREADIIDPQIIGQSRAAPEMIRLLQIGVACTKPGPEDRPGMKEAAEMVEEIADRGVEEAPGGQDGHGNPPGSSRDWKGTSGEVEDEQWSGDLLSI